MISLTGQISPDGRTTEFSCSSAHVLGQPPSTTFRYEQYVHNPTTGAYEYTAVFTFRVLHAGDTVAPHDLRCVNYSDTQTGNAFDGAVRRLSLHFSAVQGSDGLIGRVLTEADALEHLFIREVSTSDEPKS